MIHPPDQMNYFSQTEDSQLLYLVVCDNWGSHPLRIKTLNGYSKEMVIKSYVYYLFKFLVYCNLSNIQPDIKSRDGEWDRNVISNNYVIDVKMYDLPFI